MSEKTDKVLLHELALVRDRLLANAASTTEISKMIGLAIERPLRRDFKNASRIRN